jgi:integrase
LIAVTKLRTCQELWDTCLKHKTNVKGSTITNYRDCQRIFFKTFSPAEPIENITTEALLDWKTAMLGDHKEASIAGRVKVAKMIFNWAVEMEWLTKNPMQKISNGSFVNQENDRTISMEEYAKLLEACPNQEWRTIIALARIGGLRCPSELMRLRWTDINWEQNRFLIRASKTERYERHRERIVPLFPALRSELDRHFFFLDETDENEFVIESFQRTSWRLFIPFQKIAHRAGLGTIDMPFRNMRRSRSNEVEREFGTIKESLWIGHSAKVKQDHYFRLTDEDFSSAAGVDLEGKISHAKVHANETV